MATNRFGYSDDFVLKNGKVGINTAEPQATLDVQGTIKATNLKTTGVTTVTAYEGFLNADHKINESTTITNGASLSGEIIVGTGVTVTVGAVGVATALVGIGTNYTGSSNIDTTDVNVASQGAIDSLKVYNTFNPPVGGTNDRPIKAKPGQLYYNQDFKTIEFWDGNNWRQVDYTTQSGRGVYMNGSNPSLTTYAGLLIDYVSIPSLGNAQDFGESTVSTSYRGTCGSSTRGLTGGGYNASSPNQEITIDYITIQSTGDALDFGDLGAYFRNCDAASSSTRGIWFAGGHPSYFNEIEYVEISTLGSSLDFGDQTNSGAIKSATSNSRYAFAHGGFPAYSNSIDKVTISSKGNAITFGNLDGNNLVSVGFLSNETRGVFAGGYYSPAGIRVDTMTYMTLETGGNVSDFGNLTQARNPAGTNTATRGIFAGGYSSGPVTYHNIIDYITIATLGDAQDFGDLVINRSRSRGTSDSHGGLGGF